MPKFTLHTGNAKEVLSALPAQSVQTCVTSPPYFGLRDYGMVAQIGLEGSPKAYVNSLVEVFDGVRKVLKGDGTLWLNLGDSYSASGNGGRASKQQSNKGSQIPPRKTRGFPSKQLLGIPWRVAFALQEAGWYLRSDIIWSKPSPMPESVIDRPTRAHEYFFLLAKKKKYFYDREAIMEPIAESTLKDSRLRNAEYEAPRPERGFVGSPSKGGGLLKSKGDGTKRNKRTVWTVAAVPFVEDHFATFPPELITPCILAGSRPGDTVLDPFSGSGTTGIVSLKHGRRYVGIDLNPEYNRMAEGRLGGKIYERPKGKEVQQQPTLF